ncbi:MAG: tripartite tricarboxylate transporter TctB family protein [Halofilum sp. (in: g-proteobacteria)]|nr:tripartite tricarboxylate transporter TctB family protein [Halofilum sp. (in: g-proteobacteria)]
MPLWIEAGSFPGSGTIFPRVMLGVLVVLALGLLLRSLIPATRRVSDFLGSADPAPSRGPSRCSPWRQPRSWRCFHVGFFAAMIGFCVLTYFVLQVDNRRLYAGAVLILLAFVYAVFVVFLNVPLTADKML